MADPQVLYVVTAIVVLALVAWVIAVLTRAPDGPSGAPGGTKVGPDPASKSEASASSSRAKESPAKGDAKPPLADAPPAKKSAPEATARPDTERKSASVRIDVEEEEEPTGPYALILISAVGRTDPGLKRKHNEDAYVILENRHLFVIADGMGRHAAGEVASKLAVDAIGDAFLNKTLPSWTPDGAMPKRAAELRNAILLANEKVYAQSREVDEYAGMGTTVVSCFFSPNNQRVYIAHVGDSRCYRYRGAVLSQLTKDHTLGAAGIQGKSSSVLSRAVGVEERVDVDLHMESPLPGDLYLLCSDGLSRMVTDDEIASTLSTTKDLDACATKLIETANARGGRDNITTILVRVEDAPRTSSAPLRVSDIR
jgi:protein phosphatase